jgi:AraC-like DNA-binding protein
MESEGLIYFAAPPLPYYLESGEDSYQPGYQHPSRKQLGVFDLIVMESGCLFIGEETRQWSLKAGQSLLLLPDRYHYSIKPAEEATHFYWAHFQALGQWEQGGAEPIQLNHEAHYQHFLTYPYSLHIPQHWTLPYPEQAFRLMRTLNKAGGERQSSAFWAQQQTFEELLRMMDLRQNESTASPVVTLAEQTEAYIKNNYRAELTSTTLSEALNFHYNYITRCMKQVYGVTPTQYLAQYRLEQAKLLLLKTEWPIAEIALHVGFQNVPYFTNCFTEQIGLAPSKFRRQYTN